MEGTDAFFDAEFLEEGLAVGEGHVDAAGDEVGETSGVVDVADDDADLFGDVGFVFEETESGFAEGGGFGLPFLGIGRVDGGDFFDAGFEIG